MFLTVLEAWKCKLSHCLIQCPGEFIPQMTAYSSVPTWLQGKQASLSYFHKNSNPIPIALLSQSKHITNSPYSTTYYIPVSRLSAPIII